MRRITSHSRAHRSSSAALRLCLVSLALAGGLAACAPQNTGATYSSATMGVPAAVTYGVVKGTRPVTVQSGRSGVGTAAGEAQRSARHPEHAWRFGTARVLDGLAALIE